MAWILANYYKDEEVEWQKLQLLCRFINPDAAKQIFDQENVDTFEVTDDDFFQEINEHSSEKVDNQKLQNALNSRISDQENLDIIVPVEE